MYYQPSTNMLQLYIVHVYFKILVMSTENLFYKFVLDHGSWSETSIVSKAVVIGFARLENTDVNTFDLTDVVWSITRFEMLPSALWLVDLSCREGSDSFSSACISEIFDQILKWLHPDERGLFYYRRMPKCAGLPRTPSSSQWLTVDTLALAFKMDPFPSRVCV